MGRALREDDHDVYALDSVKVLEGLQDSDVMELAISEDRVLVTANVSDFMVLIRALAAERRSHYGCILIPGSIRNEEFGVIVSGIRRALEGTSQEDWTDQVEWIKR